MDVYLYIEQAKLAIIDNIDIFIANLRSHIYLLITVIVAIQVTYRVGMYLVNIQKGFDPFILVRPCLALAGVVLYEDLVDLFLFRPFRILNDMIEAAILTTSYGVQGVSGTNSLGGIGDLDAAFNTALTATDTRLYDVLAISPLLETFHLIMFSVASIIGWYILFRQLITLAIHYILGYFVLVFTLIPGNEKAFSTWILSTMTILLWEPLLTILKFLIVMVGLEQNMNGFASVIVVPAVQILVIFAVFRVPHYAQLLISGGTSIGGRVGSMVSSAITNKVQSSFGGSGNSAAQQDHVNRISSKRT